MPLRQNSLQQTPKQVRDQNRRGTTQSAGLTFPSSMPDGPAVVFAIQKYKFDADPRKVNRPISKLAKAHVKLPLPLNLNDSLNHGYSSSDLGLPRFSYKAGQDVGGALQTSGFEAALSTGVDASLDVGEYVARNALSKMSEGLGNLFNAVQGNVANPFATMLYQRTDQKVHQFQWKLQPLNRQDSQIIKEIIDTFRYYSMAKMNGLYLEFPHIFQIAFVGTPGLYGIAPCVLEGVETSYTPHQAATFYSGTSMPAQVEFSLRFREIEPQTKDSIEGTEWMPRSLQIDE
ncbi:MAG: hypothetical protein DDT26_00662 [Dehalococcoidia bacterium]|nr:hypothetical protein [Chloroflexota bacterium]